jgi:hypothetical protein
MRLWIGKNSKPEMRCHVTIPDRLFSDGFTTPPRTALKQRVWLKTRSSLRRGFLNLIFHKFFTTAGRFFAALFVICTKRLKYRNEPRTENSRKGLMKISSHLFACSGNPMFIRGQQ